MDATAWGFTNLIVAGKTVISQESVLKSVPVDPPGSKFLRQSGKERLGMRLLKRISRRLLRRRLSGQE
jgi:hypothetical protein